MKTAAARAFLWLAAALAVVAMATTAGPTVHAQQTEESRPPRADLSIASEQATRPHPTHNWKITVRNNPVADFPGTTATIVKVKVSIDKGGVKATETYTIRDLPAGRSVNLFVPFPVPAQGRCDSSPVLSRIHAEITETDPLEPPGLRFNNATENVGRFCPSRKFVNGDTAVRVSVSDRSPQPGGATTFTVTAENDPGPPVHSTRDQNNVQFDVLVKISLSPGLSFGTTTAPDGTMFSTTTGIWDVGTLTSTGTGYQLPVAVNLTGDSLADIPLEKRCLTAEVVRAKPWFDWDGSKRLNDTYTACLGEQPKVLLTKGKKNLFDFYPCVGVMTAPCTSADTLELLVTDALTTLEPDELLVHLGDAEARKVNNGEPIWSTEGIFEWKDSQERIPRSDWRAAREDMTVTGPDGGQLPGSFTVKIGNLRPVKITDTTKVPGSPFDQVGGALAVILEFGSLGTYVLTMDISATHKSGTPSDTSDDETYTDSGTYTFLVGPMADLEVRGAGASPAVAAGRRGYTVMALNNGPDIPPAVQVMLSGVPEGAEAVISHGHGTYAQGTCESGICAGVWAVGELGRWDHRAAGHANEGPTLTLITDAMMPADITATIGAQPYTVCIDSMGDDVDAASENACTATSGNTWHSTEYYDLIERNNTATITAVAGSGAGRPDAPEGVQMTETPVGKIVQWQPVETVNEHEVTHYEVQRSASPWETLSNNPKETVYTDMASGTDDPTYRVRAVNIFGVPGSWSEPSSRRPGVPKDFTATVAAGGGQIDLSWGAPDDVTGVTVSGYDVEYLDGATWTSLTGTPTLNGTTYTQSHTGLTLLPGEVRQYRVRTVGADGGKDVMSEWATASVTVADPKPGAPTSFTASIVSDTKANLSWGAPGGVTHVDVTGYEFGFSKDGGNSWESLTDQAATATSFTHTHGALSAGDTRQYRARTVGTVSSGGQTVTVKSDWAFAVAMINHPAPGVPKSFTATGVSDAQANLEWDAPDTVTGVSVTGYEVDFSKDGGNTWTRLTGTPTQSGMTWTQSHTDNTLGADAVRQYRVLTVGTVSVGGETVTVRSGWAFAAATRDYPTPGAPRNFIASAISQSQVNLSWSQPETVTGVSITGYDLDFSTDGAMWTSLAQGRTQTTFPHTDNALAAGVIRQYRLRAVGQDSNSAVFRSGWVFASAATEAVGPPLNLSARAHGSGRIDLSWGLPGFGENLVTGYRIDYTLASPEQWQTAEHDHPAGASPRRYEHHGLSPGQQYCYRVAAVHAGGTGPFSTQACATTDVEPTHLPGQPEDLRITQVGGDYVTLEWDPPSVGGAVQYYEWRSNAHAPTRVPGAATRVWVGSLATGSTYDFQVRAWNSNGAGQWSGLVRATPHQAGSAVVASPLELKVAQGGSGSFNVRLKRSPEWPLQVYLHFEGPSCLTESLIYQQAKILLPSNPDPSKEFWNDDEWGPPDDRHAAPWNVGVNFLVDVPADAPGCKDGATAVVNYDLVSLPFSYLEGMSLWERLSLNQEEWREKWGVDPLDGIIGPSVKLTVVDGARAARTTAGEQSLSSVIAGGAAVNVSVTFPPQAAVWRREERGLYGFPLAWDWWE